MTNIVDLLIPSIHQTRTSLAERPTRLQGLFGRIIRPIIIPYIA